ncbi:MAG: hypothetical protein N3A69_16130, partial [Leptospiraceae bacterium]|nr:hypothetical protein [Leptospiraceae bacterium]
MKKYTRLAILILAGFSLFVANCSSGDKKEESTESQQEAAVTAKCVDGDCKNGKGVLEYSNGDKYEGEFKQGRFEGKGKYSFKAGDVYEGDFVQDKFSGKGKYTFCLLYTSPSPR